MAKRLIGYATTNSNGVATINYIGQGLGELSVTAETGGEMLFHHIGVDNTETNPFYYNSNNIQTTTDSTGTLLTNSSSTTYNYYANIGATSELYDFIPPYTIEFDVVSYSATYCGIQTTETGKTGALRNFSQLTNKTSFHIKVTVDGSKIIYQIDNDTPIEQTYSTSKVRISLTLNNGTMKYKNFFIYKGTSTLVSDTITVIDGLFHDKGISGQSSSDWYNASNRITVTVQSDGTLLETSSNNGYYFANLNGTSTGSTTNVRDYTTPICVEVDLVEVDTNYVSDSQYYGLMFNDGTDHRLALKDINPNAKHLKIKLDGTNAICYADTLTNPVTIPLALTGNFAISLMVRSTSYIKYKNFVIYPL